MNPRFWEWRLSMNDTELDNCSLNKEIKLEFEEIKNNIMEYNIINIIINKKLPYILYNKIYDYIDFNGYVKIKNTRCIIKKTRNIEQLIYNSINYDTHNLLNYEIIDNIFIIKL